MAVERDATEKAESLGTEGPSEDIDYIIRHGKDYPKKKF
jgi:hypothetical protein